MAPNTETLELVTETAGDHFDVVIPDDMAAIFQGKPERAPNADGSQRQAGDTRSPVATDGNQTKVEDKPAVVEPKRKMSPARAAQVERARKIDEAARRVSVRRNTTDTQVPALAVPARQADVLKQFEEVAGAGDLKAAGQLLLEEGDRRAREYSQVAVIADRDARIQRQEKRAQDRWGDWNKKLQDAGVFDGCKKVGFNSDGSPRYANQEMGEAIYGEDNPAEAAYELAETILKIRSGEPLEDEIENAVPQAGATEQSAAVAKTVTAPAPKAQDGILDEVSRPKGISNLGNAGQPRMSFSRADLDDLMDKNPDAYLRLVDANKSLGDWHMGRTE